MEAFLAAFLVAVILSDMIITARKIRIMLIIELEAFELVLLLGYFLRFIGELIIIILLVEW
jgi:hypothetical protein